ncbi:Broad specificity phosphatase PhoE [Duganella sacchari]|uniref:Broad specificity phosphatase PhoE n=1 Tax=Duganella sacchari TaxID=551987 RepID=A0A1M7P8U2_9BURK|nr:histidine phosphatase family protein [Duganella sacchari]SHN13075.1 Broad specificity phosphatase PhoE [Duganella sacchari]
MHLRLLLISHAATAAMRSGRFPSDDALDERGIEATQAWRPRIEAMQAAAAFRSTAVCVGETARLLNLDAAIAPALAEIDFGRWTGQGLADLAAAEPDSLATWLSDPQTAPHGGESFGALAARVGAWLDALPDTSGTVIALTHASVIRAAILHALGAPLSAHARIEVAPLSLVELRRSARGWSWITSPQDSVS